MTTRISSLLFVVFALALVSACAQNDATTEEFAAAEGNLVTSATYNVEGDLFEVQITVADGVRVDGDALIDAIELVRGDVGASEAPEWLTVEIFPMDAGVATWRFKEDSALGEHFTFEANPQITKSDVWIGSDWEVPGLTGPRGSGSIDYKPETEQVDTSSVNIEHPYFDPTNFDPDDYNTEATYPRRKKHHKKHH